MTAAIQANGGKIDVRVTLSSEICRAMRYMQGFQLLGLVSDTNPQHIKFWFPVAGIKSHEPALMLDYKPSETPRDRLVFRKSVDPDLLRGFIGSREAFIGNVPPIQERKSSLTMPIIACLSFLRPEIATTASCPDSPGMTPAVHAIKGEPDGDVRSLLASMESFVHQADPVLTAASGSDDSFDGVWCRVLEHANGDILNRFARSASRMCADIIAISGRGGK